MNLTNKEVHSFGEHNLKTFNLTSFTINKDKAINSLINDIKDELEDLNSSETMILRKNHYNLKGVSTEDFLERVVRIEQEKIIIAGIRHLGGNKNYPFVSLNSNFNLTIQNAQIIYKIYLEKYFKKFSPESIRFWSDQKIPDTIIGASYLVTTVKELSRLENRKEERSIEFEDILNDNYYEWYSAIYEKFHKRSPE